MGEFEPVDEGASPIGFVFSLSEIVQIVKRRVGLILTVTAILAFLAIAYALSLPTLYEATAAVLIESRERKVLDFDAVLSGISTDTPTIESEVEILRSRATAIRVIRTLRLDRDPEFTGAESALSRILNRIGIALGGSGDQPGEDVAQMESVSESTASNRVDDGLVGQFVSRLRVARRRNTLLIELGFSSREAKKAARIVNAVAEAYLADQIEAKSEAAAMATSWLERRIGVLRDRVFQTEKKIERFKTEHNLLASEGHPLGEKQLARLMEQLIGARTTTAMARAKYRQASRLIGRTSAEASLADVLQSHTITNLRAQLARASRRSAELMTRYGPLHPTIKQTRAELQDIHAQIGAEIKRIVVKLKNEYDVAQSQEASIASSLERLKTSTAISNEDGVELRELEREAAANRIVYETLLRRYRETAEQASLQMPDARIVERAAAAGVAKSSKRKLIVAIGGFLGLSFGLGFAVLLELLKPTILNAKRVRGRIGADHLASVPAVPPRRLDPNDRVKALRYIMVEPGAPYSEAIRSLRVELDQRVHGLNSRVILITSAEASDGRSMIASNLAHQFSLTGLRTLIVDCDMRRATISQSFLPAREAGLLDVLSNYVPLHDAIYTDSTSGISLLPAKASGGSRVAPGEVLGSTIMAQVFAALRREFDVIIVDSPPMARHVDARVLAAYADQIALVMDWGKTSHAQARSAIESLSAYGSRVAGVVVNHVTSEQSAALSASVDTGEQYPVLIHAAA